MVDSKEDMVGYNEDFPIYQYNTEVEDVEDLDTKELDAAMYHDEEGDVKIGAWDIDWLNAILDGDVKGENLDSTWMYKVVGKKIEMWSRSHSVELRRAARLVRMMTRR